MKNSNKFKIPIINTELREKQKASSKFKTDIRLTSLFLFILSSLTLLFFIKVFTMSSFLNVTQGSFHQADEPNALVQVQQVNSVHAVIIIFGSNDLFIKKIPVLICFQMKRINKIQYPL